jgi:hypothetical protein
MKEKRNENRLLICFENTTGIEVLNTTLHPGFE